MNFKAIIFDLGGVILDIDYEATINAFKELGKENFEELYTQANQTKLFDRFETGMISPDEFRDEIRNYLGYDLEDGMIDDAWNALLGDLPEERIELLRKLKKDYPIYLFSNTNDIHYHEFRKIIRNTFGKTDILEDIFKKTYYSHLVGKRKPNADAFQLVLNEQGLKANETLFIDDSIQHIEGAKELGLQTIHLVDKEITELF